MLTDEFPGAQPPITPRSLLAGGLALGLAADLLIWVDGPAPAGYALWVLLLALPICVLTRREGTVNPAHVPAWCAVGCLAAGLLMLRSALILIPALWLLQLLAATMLVGRHLRTRLRDLGPGDLLFGCLQVALRMLASLPLLLFRSRSARSAGSDRRLALLRGLLILAPLLLIFTLLFSAADATFSRSTSSLLSWIGEDLALHLIEVLLFCWLATGLLAATLLKTAPGAGPRREPARLGELELTVVLGGLSLLFIVFVALQLGYLFGGRETIETTTGLTLAAYARRGFFELMSVAALTLALLLALAGRNASPGRFRPFALVLIACVLLMQVSAAQRLSIYIDEYGLSLDRLVAAAAMLWLSLVLLLFAAGLCRGSDSGFVYTAVSAGATVLLALALLNPAGLVTRVNIERSLNEARRLDVHYLVGLGPDAVPALFERFDELPPFTQCEIAQLLAERRYRESTEDWRRFHYARWRAERELDPRREALRAFLPEAPVSGEPRAPSLGAPLPMPGRNCLLFPGPGGAAGVIHIGPLFPLTPR